MWLRCRRAAAADYVGAYVSRNTGFETPFTWRLRFDTAGVRRWGISWQAANIPQTCENDIWALEIAGKFSRGPGDGAGVARSMRLINQNSWNNPFRIDVDYR